MILAIYLLTLKLSHIRKVISARIIVMIAILSLNNLLLLIRDSIDNSLLVILFRSITPIIFLFYLVEYGTQSKANAIYLIKATYAIFLVSSLFYMSFYFYPLENLSLRSELYKDLFESYKQLNISKSVYSNAGLAPNQWLFSPQLISSIILSIFFCFSTKGLKLYFSMIILIIVTWALISAGNRAGIISIIVAVLFFSKMSKLTLQNYTPKAMLIGFTLLAMVFLTLPLLENTNSSVGDAFRKTIITKGIQDYESGNTADRLGMQVIAVNIILRYPEGLYILGKDWASEAMTLGYEPIRDINGDYAECENSYLRAMVNFGWLVAALVILFFYFIVKEFRKTVWKYGGGASDSGLYYIFSTGVLLSLFILGLFNNSSILNLEPSCVTFLALSIVWGKWMEHDSKITRGRHPNAIY